MVEKVERRNEREAKSVGRRRFLRYALGFSFLSTLIGVLTPIIGYLWPPKRAAIAKSGRVVVDGEVAPCCPQNRPNAEDLRAVGLGRPI